MMEVEEKNVSLKPTNGELRHEVSFRPAEENPWEAALTARSSTNDEETNNDQVDSGQQSVAQNKKEIQENTGFRLFPRMASSKFVLPTMDGFSVLGLDR